MKNDYECICVREAFVDIKYASFITVIRKSHDLNAYHPQHL
jgi:hypothetical protein